jgi:hypothetical protein
MTGIKIQGQELRVDDIAQITDRGAVGTIAAVTVNDNAVIVRFDTLDVRIYGLDEAVQVIR